MRFCDFFVSFPIVAMSCFSLQAFAELWEADEHQTLQDSLLCCEMGFGGRTAEESRGRHYNFKALLALAKQGGKVCE